MNASSSSAAEEKRGRKEAFIRPVCVVLVCVL